MLQTETKPFTTVVFAVTDEVPFVTVIVYSPYAKLPVDSNVATVLSSFHVSFPSTLSVPFVITNSAETGTALSKFTANFEALVALKLVIAPSI